MKKCPDCGMVIANQAIRCPKCKYTFTSADEGDAGAEAVVTPQAAAVSAAATGKSDKVAGIMPMIEVNKDNYRSGLFLHSRPRWKKQLPSKVCWLLA